MSGLFSERHCSKIKADLPAIRGEGEESMDNIYLEEVRRKAVAAIIDMKLKSCSEDIIRINNDFQIWFRNFIDMYPDEYFSENLMELFRFSELVRKMAEIQLFLTMS